MTKLGLLAGCIALIAAAPVLANWQYTSWGMTSEQVGAAAKAAGKELTPVNEPRSGGFVVKHSGIYTDAFPPMKLALLYNNDNLSIVELSHDQDGKCYAFELDLFKTYGHPFSKRDMMVATISTWRDEKRGNVVEYWRYTDMCSLRYTPLLSNSAL